jgi:isopenicillin N synthase-like dioxygenase
MRPVRLCCRDTQVWTNGLYVPTLHRVVHTASAAAGGGPASRVSAPFFYEPSFRARVAPLPRFGSPPRFEPIVYGEHLLSKAATNFGQQQAAGL